ncbi:hypothetical protein ACUSJO_000055 [Escherichia albertii]
MPDATHARLIMPGVLRVSHPVIPVAYPPSTPLIFRRSDKALTPHPTMRADATHARFIMPGGIACRIWLFPSLIRYQHL